MYLIIDGVWTAQPSLTYCRRMASQMLSSSHLSFRAVQDAKAQPRSVLIVGAAHDKQRKRRRKTLTGQEAAETNNVSAVSGPALRAR
ncbi:hypothetical protein HPB47_019089 [Ixodes persulcatus]|uniref:Uncharacterized protein n=1 Tax=Ixodes persulcatus TaxID=34615 RepID=A0AC60QJY4_IXOPE|nr:hypothetical protein HPB47_019089 [Ixodes persulcatus]